MSHHSNLGDGEDDCASRPVEISTQGNIGNFTYKIDIYYIFNTKIKKIQN